MPKIILCFLLLVVIPRAAPAGEFVECVTCSEEVQRVARTEGVRAGMETLLDELARWVVEHSDIPLWFDTTNRPQLKFVPHSTLQLPEHTQVGGEVIALYVFQTRTILFTDRWDYSPYYVSYLVHDMYYTNGYRIPDCRLEEETLAYELQRQWAKEQGYPMDILMFKPGELALTLEC